MVSPLQEINAGRRPVVLYAPGRQPVAAPAPRVGPGRPPPIGGMRPTTRRGAAAEAQSPWAGFAERVTSTKAAQEALQQKAQQQAEEEQGGFWGSDFGKGLGFVINNPLTRAVSMPLNYLQTAGRGITLGMEEARQALPEGPEWLQDAAAAAPLGLAGLFLRTDPDRDESDKRSNWEKVFSPETSYGYGEIAKPTGNKWADRAIGLAGDIALDPLTYVGAGGARAVKGVSQVSQAADELKLATRALDAATEAGKAKQIAKAQKRLAQAEEYVARAPEMGEATIMKQMPRTRAERVQMIAELEGTEEGRRIIEEFGGELQRAGKRGFHTASQELKDAMGIQPAGLRVRGATTPIPGTRLLGEGIAKVGGGLRVGGHLGLERLPERVQNLRVPVGLENSFKVLTREAEGDVLLAATDVASRNRIRIGTGSQRARGGRRIINMMRKGTKGLDKEQIQKLRREAETLPEANLFNDIAKGILETYQKITGRVIDPQYLRNSATYLPHLLDPKFRRVLAKASKNGDQAALDFMTEAGLHTDELLEEGAFYVDNMLEGSGFLEKSRKFGTDPKTGQPRTVNIAGKEITFEADDLDHINDKLREAFPTYKGDFYDTDPARILEAYNTSLARQAGRDMARQHLVDTKNPLAFVNEGDIRKTQVAMDEALSQQGAAPLLATAQGKYDPTMPLPEIAERPVVPGSAENRARQAVMTEAQGDLATARTPEELQAATEALEATPAPAPQFGDVVPEKYFVTTKGTAATAARDADVKRAQTYARAATAETRKAEAAVREAVAEVREEIVSPLRTAVADTKKEVTAINRKLRQWAKKVSDFGPLDADNADDLLLTHSHINQEISNIETKIRRTRGQFKGRATRAQRRAENELKQSLDRLRKVRDDIQKNVREAPARMKEEYDTRLEALDRPVKETKDALDAKEDAFITQRPAPYGQAQVDAARDVVAKGEEFPVNDILNAQREKYRTVLEEITDINTRRTKTGSLTRPDRTRMNQLVKEADDLKVTLQRAVNQEAKVSPYDQAQDTLNDLRAKLIDTPQAEIPALQRQIDELDSQFAPGGKFAEERRARRIVKRTDEWDAELAAHTQAERELWQRAKDERATRQEAIIWARSPEIPEHMRTRHVTRPGQPLSDLEQLGWRAGETRYPESITGGVGFEGEERIPQPAAWKTERVIEDVVGGQVSPSGETVQAPGIVQRPGPVPQPRTEVEALESLQGQMKYGSPAQQATRIPLKQAQQDLLDATTAAPHQIVAEKAKIAEDFGKLADEAVGGDVLKTETFTNLAGDVNRKAQLVRKRDELTDLRDRINKTKPKYRNHSLGKTIDEIEDVARNNPLLDDEKLTQTESVLQTHRQELERIDDTKMRISDLDRVAADAESGKLGNVMIAALHDNWRVGHGGPLGEGDIVVATELHKRINNLFEVSRQPQALGRAFNAFTNLFKTYATLSPGFFVRNSIGGIFMNTSDGVGLLTQAEGADLWRTFVHKDTHPDWLDTQPRRVQEAFAAAFASGAGGRFEDAGVLARTNSRAYNMLSSNPATRKAQRVGSKVEGAMRLGMALDSFDKGMDVTESLARISRVHFDYGQVSQLDDTMKRIIPFWTFMSRNLPLQIQQQWTNPRVYSYYNHLVQNFKLPDEEFTPDYWKRQGAWNTPLSIGGNQIYAQPDLGFTRVQSDIDMLGDALGGENAGALFGQANPALGATLDFLQQRDSFYNRQYTDADYRKMTGPIGGALSLIAKPLGQTNEAGQVSENFVNYLSSLAPPLNQAMRLLPEASGGQRSADTWSKWARYGGVPTQLLTPAAQDSEYWRQWREIQDEAKRQQAMAREAAS